jgi:hypothetical protein
VAREVGRSVNRWRSIFLADLSKVEGPSWDSVEHVIFIVKNG